MADSHAALEDVQAASGPTHVARIGSTGRVRQSAFIHSHIAAPEALACVAGGRLDQLGKRTID